MATIKRKKIAFVKLGTFSHTNENVYDILKREFPDCKIDIIDIWEEIIKWKSLSNIIYATIEYGIKIFYSKKNLLNALIYNSYIFNEVKKRIALRIKASDYIFTFQTQSIFDTSVDGIPNFVYTDHTVLANKFYPNFDFDKKVFYRKWLKWEKSIYENAAINFTMSSNISKSMIEQYKCNPNKVMCVYAGQNIPLHETQSNKDRYQIPHILFVGVAWERKGGPTLIEAFKIIAETHPTVKLTIVGCSPNVDIPNCNIVGKIPLSKVSEYYKSASIFCLPTTVEPFGLVFLEAMFYRLPIVATNIGALPDFIIDNQNGYKVEPNNPKELADKLLLLLNDPNKCERFGEFGHNLFLEKYNWEKVGNRMHKHIEALISSRK